MNQQPPTILCIGDTVCDAFIELIDAHVTCKIDNSACELSMKFGDKIPFRNDYILYGVGNSANAAVSCARLGLPAELITHIGDDDNGDRTLNHLASEHVGTSGIVTEPGAKTNYHYVLWYRPERTILVKHEQYHYDFQTELQRISGSPTWVYLSSIGSGTEQYHDDISRWIRENPTIQLVFQPGTFQMKLGYEKLRSIYERSNLFFCNIEESERILGLPEGGNRSADHIKHLLEGIAKLGPRITVLTDGPNGAYAYDGTNYYYCPMYPDVAPPLERTGAGDAYASTFTAYYAQGYSVTDCMLRAPINSMNVVQHVGAQAGLLDNSTIEEYLAKAPESYRVTEI